VFWQAMAHHIPPSFRPEGREQWRNEIIEECAEIAGQMDGFYDWEIATAILALKRPAPQDKP
jgi:hypothetical protein